MFEKRLQDIEKHLRKNGYQYKTPKNLLDSKSNTVFVGSGTNTFLDEIVQTEFAGKYYSIQPCIRCHNLKQYDQYYKENADFFYRSFFEMLGTMEEGALDETRFGMYCKMIFQSFNIEKNNIVVVLPAKFKSLKDYITEELGILKVKIEENERFTKWSYGVPYLEGTGIAFYTAYENKIIQIFDIVEIEDKRSLKRYVETGLAIDNFRIFNREYDRINTIFEQIITKANVKEKIYFDSLIGIAEIYKALEQKRYVEEIRQKCIREKYTKYVLACGNEIGKSEEDILKEIDRYLSYQGSINNELAIRIHHDMRRINNNMENILKQYKNYLKNTETIDVEYVKGTLGVLGIWI